MSVKHAHQTAIANHPENDISATVWNADHAVSLVNAEVATTAAIVESKLALDRATLLSGFPFRQHPGDFIWTYVGTTSFSIGTGKILDSTLAYGLTLADAITKTLSAWAVGTGNGGLDTGSIAASTTYHVYIIRKTSDGTLDIIFSLSATAPTLPTGYAVYKWIKRFRTNASSQILSMFDHGQYFIFAAKQEEKAYGTLPDTDRHYVEVKVPENTFGIFIAAWGWEDANATHYGEVTSAEEEQVALSASNFDTQMYLASAMDTKEQMVWVNNDRAIAYRGNSAAMSLIILSRGFFDPKI